MAEKPKTVQYGDTEFVIGSLLVEEGWDLLEDLRVGLARGSSSLSDGIAGALGGEDTSRGAALFGSLAQLLLALPKDTLADIRRTLFQHIRFTNASVTKPTPLLGQESLAFQNLTPAHVYLLLGEAFKANFGGSWAVAQELLQPILGSSENDSA